MLAITDASQNPKAEDHLCQECRGPSQFRYAARRAVDHALFAFFLCDHCTHKVDRVSGQTCVDKWVRRIQGQKVAQQQEQAPGERPMTVIE